DTSDGPDTLNSPEVPAAPTLGVADSPGQCRVNICGLNSGRCNDGCRRQHKQQCHQFPHLPSYWYSARKPACANEGESRRATPSTSTLRRSAAALQSNSTTKG